MSKNINKFKFPIVYSGSNGRKAISLVKVYKFSAP